MPWTPVTFGKHRDKRKTLPQLLFFDPDWFFYCYENGYFENQGLLRDQAEIIYIRARNIRIRENEGRRMVAEYFIHRPTNKFGTLQIVPENQSEHIGSSATYRRNVIDLNFPRQFSNYDKLGYKNFLSDLKLYLFDNRRKRMTKEICEDFFNNDENFVLENE